MDEVALRVATEADLPRVATIHVAGWQTAYRGLIPDDVLDALSTEVRLAAWREWYGVPGSEVWVACRGHLVCGFSRLQPAQDAALPVGTLDLTHLYLDPEERGAGIGAPLFGHMLERARDREAPTLVLSVLEGNHPARRFYERAGLQPDGHRATRPRALGPDVHEVRYRIDFDDALTSVGEGAPDGQPSTRTGDPE